MWDLRFLEPEFKVTLKDSLCMAAKEHTAKMIEQDFQKANEDRVIELLNTLKSKPQVNEFRFT